VQEGTELAAYAIESSGDGVRVASRKVIRENMLGPIVAMHPDGKRLLQFSRAVPTDSGPPIVRRMIVVSNWHEVLRARLGTAKPEPR
jgi:hypothetical protein